MDINLFLGIPGLSFNIMLEIRIVKLELINKQEICEFFENQSEEVSRLLLIEQQKLTTLILIYWIVVNE